MYKAVEVDLEVYKELVSRLSSPDQTLNDIIKDALGLTLKRPVYDLERGEPEIHRKDRQTEAISAISPKHTQTDYSLYQLRGMDLKKKKPSYLEMEGEKYPVKNWTELCQYFVHHLLGRGYLNNSDLPIENSARKGKYFISLNQISEQNAQWHQVDGIFVDAKYSTTVHVKNLIHTLRLLGKENIDVKVGF